MKAADMRYDRSFALADCNNFFVSCERRLNNDLDGRPMVVLSSNDGCVISRSDEVKKMGVRMGDPYFKVRGMLASSGVVVRSINMSLYQEVSAEVMSVIKLYTDAAEIYSIDECFFNMEISSVRDPVRYCRMIKKDVWEKSRIPISIGIAPTKTLCKLAADHAKKDKISGGIFWVERSKYMDMGFMSQFECSNIWGIGRKTSEKLARSGIRRASDLIRKDEIWIKKTLGITGLYTSWELKGYRVHDLEAKRRAPKSIMVSRSFGNPITTYEEMLDPLLCFAASAARRLRKTGQAAGKMTVFISTDRFNREDYYSNARDTSFLNPVSYDADLMVSAERMLKEIFMRGHRYKKCGVILSALSDVSAGRQMTLFDDAGSCEKKTRGAAAVDYINEEYSHSIIKPAVLFEVPGHEKKWAPKSEFVSGRRRGRGSSLPDGLRFQTHSEDFIT